MQAALRDLAKHLIGKDPKQRLERAKLRLQKRIFRRPFSLEELEASLLALGEWRGRTVWVQASWDRLYNLQAKPGQLLSLMRHLVGRQGNLVMPAFPIDQDSTKIFNVDTAPAGAGILSEILRRQAEAERSIHLRNSVCAIGPDALEICSRHHLTPYSFGEQSPFGFFRRVDALCVLLGTVPMGFTPLHYVECAMHEEGRPLPGVLGAKVEYRWKRRSGEEGVHWFYDREGRLAPERLRRHFTSDEYRTARISNVLLQAMSARTGIDLALKLARQGVTIYPHV